eukprot:1148988-Pelagomonas_calceolata.AAC.8
MVMCAKGKEQGFQGKTQQGIYAALLTQACQRRNAGYLFKPIAMRTCDGQALDGLGKKVLTQP